MNRRRTLVSLALASLIGITTVTQVSPASSQSTGSTAGSTADTAGSAAVGTESATTPTSPNEKSTPTTRPPASYASLANAKPNPNLTVVFSSPEGAVNTTSDASEIRWLFDRPVSELTEAADVSAQVGRYVTFSPPLRGSFRWASTRMLVFNPKIVANATAYTVTLQGLPALDGTTVAAPYTLTFTTPPASCDVAEVRQFDTELMYRIQCDQKVDPESVAKRVKIVLRTVRVNPKRYAPRAADRELMAKEDPTGLAAIEEYFATVGKRPRDLAVLPLRLGPRPKGSSCENCVFLYRERTENYVDAVSIVELGQGIVSLEGPLLSKRRLIGREELPRTPLIVTAGCRVNCNPQNGFALESVGFKPSAATADGLIKVVDETPNVGDDPVQVFNPAKYESYMSEEPLNFRWATFVPGHRYRIVIDKRTADSGGHMLGYTSITTVSFGRSSAYGYIRDGELILAPEATGVRLRSKNVTSIAYVERRLDADELVNVIRSFNNFPKAKPLSYNDEKQRDVKLNIRNDVETVSVLKAGRGKKGKETGVYLIAAKPTSFVQGSRYNANGEPWSKADETAQADTAGQTDETDQGSTVESDSGSTGEAGNGGWSTMLLQRTNLGVTVKSSAANVFVAVTDLSSGKAVKDAKVSLYDGATSKRFFDGKTDANGFVTAKSESLPNCDTCEVIAVVEKGKDLGYTQSRWRDWGDDAPYYGDADSTAAESTTAAAAVEPEMVGVDKAWPIRRSQTRSVALFTDRDVYKLGEKVYLKGVLRTKTAESLVFPPAKAKLPLIVRDTAGTVVVKRTVEISDVGSFEATFAIPAGGLQGSYAISVANGSASVLVAAYRKPDFVVDVKAKQKSIVRNQKVDVDVDARYLFGAPMADAETSTTARWQSTWRSLTPVDPALQNYSFTPECWDRDVRPCGAELDGTELPTDTTPLNSVGHQSFSAIATAPKGPMRTYELAIESNVTDVSRQAFADRTSVTVYPGTFSFGVSTDYVVEARKPLPVSVVSIDNNGKIVLGKKGEIQVDEWRWVVAKRKAADGSISETGSYELKRVATLPVVTESKPVVQQVTVPNSGSYEIRVVGLDEIGNQLEASKSFYAYGAGEVSWRTTGDQAAVELVADKPTYRVGDAATILVKSPWTKSEALVTVEGSGVLSSQRVTLNSSAESIKVPIEKSFAPNAYVTIALFSPKGKTPKEREIQAGQPPVISGSVELSVPPTDQTLKVTVTSPQKSYLPGTATKVAVNVADSKGAARASEVTLWAVDEGVLRLSNYSEPDLLASFYSARYNDVITADGRMRLQRTADEAEKGESDSVAAEPGGGGGSEAATVDGVRKDFRTLAVWAGSVNVPESGAASVDVKLPDSLTSYRVIGVAAADADRFGVGTSSVEVRKPFMLQPSLPRFVNIGDTFEAGVVVFNQTGTPGPVTVSVTPPASGLRLTGPALLTLPNVGDKPVEVRFSFTATGVGRPRLLFNGNLGAAPAVGTPATSDRSDVVEAFLPVIVTQRLSVVGTSGVVTATESGATSQGETITKPADAIPGVGGIELAVASSSLAGLQNGIQDLVEYPYGCLEQRTSRIRVLLDLVELDGTYQLAGVPDDLNKVVTKELQALRPFQLGNGGLSYWPDGGPVDVYLSARTLLMLRQAKRAGIAVPTGMITAITKGLQESVALKPAGESDDEEDVSYSSGFDLGALRSYVAYVLASEGKPEKGLVDVLYKDRFNLDYLEQINLLQAMLEAGEKGERVEALYRDVLSSVRIENDRAHVQRTVSSYADTTPYYLWSYGQGAEVRHSAALLTLLTKIDPKHPLIPRISRWIVQQREQGGWSNTLEIGDALHGLLSVSQTTESAAPAMTGAINLGTATLLNPTFRQRTLDVTSKTMPATMVPVGQSTFGVTAKGSGTLHWSARFRYATNAAQQKAIDQGITVERTYAPYQAVSRRNSADVAAESDAAADGDGAGTGAGTGGGDRKPAVPSGSGTTPNVSVPARKPKATTTFNAGDLVVVTLRISTPQLRTNVVIDDPLPGGLEALDAQLANTSTVASQDSTAEPTRELWWSGIDRTEIRDERVLLFATRLDSGTLEYTYIARATAPGVFTTPGTLAEEMYNPEVRGRTAPSLITIRAPGAGS